MLISIFMYIVIFLVGICVGSFLNVVIYRVPKKENIVVIHSHCMSCGYTLRWFDLVPLFSFLFLGGKCRKCKTKLSWQYPIIEFVTGILFLILFAKFDLSFEFGIYAVVTSALLSLSLIDWRTYEIPFGFNVLIGIMGICHLILDYRNWADYVIGFLCVSLFLYLLFIVSKGRAIGGGDVKMMAACGLLLGWKLIIFAFVVGCIVGSVIHLLRMKFKDAESMLAMGPYLSIGVFVAIMWGNQFVNWYLSFYR